MANVDKIEVIVARLPESTRVDIEAWDGEPTFRVNNKNFVFADREFTSLTVKLPKEEALAVVESDTRAEPCGYGLGRHGWISVKIGKRPAKADWVEIEEWIRTSYTLVAPKKLAREALAADE